MKISDAYPSNYLKASDLQGRNVQVTIGDVRMEDIGEDKKPVLYFEGKTKGMVLNKTNATTIANEYGDETADWIGESVILYAIMTEFQGKPVEGLRVRRPTAKDKIKPAKSDDDPRTSVSIEETFQ